MKKTNIILQRLRDDGFYLIHPTDVQGSYSNLAYALLGNILSEYIGSDYQTALFVCCFFLFFVFFLCFVFDKH